MSLEAMETLTSVEDRLRKQKADAAAAVKQSAVDAKAQGEAAEGAGGNCRTDP